MAAARELVIADEPAAWAALGFAPGTDGAFASPYPNGALAIDHLVAFTDDADRTAAALAAAGGDVRRRGGPPELPAPMAFVRFGELIVEVAQTGGAPRFWGLTVTVADLDALAGPLLGMARPAIQPRRRIATVRRAAGLALASRVHLGGFEPSDGLRRVDKRRRVGYLAGTMSDRSDPRPMKHIPAIAGHVSFGWSGLMLAPTNATRG